MSDPHYRVCNFCEAMCGITVTQDLSRSDLDAQIIVKPDPDDPFSKGSMCPKAPVLGPLHFDPDRLRYPVRKVRGQWQQIGWEEAYTLVASRLKSVREAHGPDAVGTYLGNPIVHNLGMLLFVKSLVKAIGSKNVFSATSMDQLPHHFAAHYMFGHEFRIPVPDIDRTDYMIIMGANPVASNGSIMTSAGVLERLRQIEKRGGKFIVIDPRKTETGKVATEHHFITPGRDVYFLLAFLHILYRDGHTKTGTLTQHITGNHLLEPLVQDYTPQMAARMTGISAADIEAMVAEYMAQDRAVLYGRMGLSTQPHGGLCHWLINCINIVSNHFDRAGGMMFSSPAIELARGEKGREPVGRWKSRVRGMNEFYGEFPVSTMAEEMAVAGKGQICAFVSICGNPVLSSPGGKRLDDLLPKLDFMVSIDNYINETTRHADVILPTPTGLEIDHYDMIFNIISVSNNAKFSESLFPPPKGRPYDWQVLKELALRISGKRDLYERFATPRRIVNWGLMLGPYGRLSHPKRWFSGLSLKKIIKSKHGINLGPLRPRIPEGLLTRDAKIHLSPQVFLDHLAALPKDMPIDGFRLIGRRNVSTNNSWMHQFAKLSKSRQVRCTVMMNDADAQRLDIEDGDQLRVASRVDTITLPVEVSNTMMPGVLSIPHGFGHTRAGTRIPNAEAKPGVSVNDITDHLRIDPLTGNAAFSGQPVQIERVAGNRKKRLETGKPLTVLYASQTGNAEMVAHDVSKAAEDHGMIADIRDMAEMNLSDFDATERVLLVCSTYGEGDMPDAALDLWEEAKVTEQNILSGTYFAVLALGDQSYDNFASAGRNWDRMLGNLGGQRLETVTCADVDYDLTAQNWMDTVLPKIGDVGDQAAIVKAGKVSQKGHTLRFNRRNPAVGRLLEKRRLTGDGSSKETIHYEIELESKGLHYNPGDTLNIVPQNDPALVDEILKQMGCEGNQRIGDHQDSLRDMLTQQYEIRTPSKPLLHLIGLDSNKDAAKLWGADILDLIRSYPAVFTDIEVLVSVLRPLSVRSYSITSSQAAHPDQVHLCVASVRYHQNGRDYGGVGSTYLADRVVIGGALNLYVAPNKLFSLPEDPTRAIIMIGPGTGIAPFRAFLEQRALSAKAGPAWLFFGDRQKAHDFLYRDELHAFLDAGTLTRLDTAFSRDQEKKVYVQDRMTEAGKTLWDWLQKDAVVYVCGDGKKMAPDVEHALLETIRTHGAMPRTDAQGYLDQMRRDKRYLLDIY